jgi:hypothetical protein
MIEFDVDNQVENAYNSALRENADIEAKMREQLTRFCVKALQYEKFVVHNDLWAIDDYTFDHRWDNEIIIYKKKKFLRKPEQIAWFRWSFDYYKWESPNALKRIKDYLHDFDLICHEMNYMYSSQSPAFKYKITSTFEVLSQFFWSTMSVSVDDALDKRISEIEVRKILTFEH